MYILHAYASDVYGDRFEVCRKGGPLLLPRSTLDFFCAGQELSSGQAVVPSEDRTLIGNGLKRFKPLGNDKAHGQLSFPF
jgi:hypothetical protein